MVLKSLHALIQERVREPRPTVWCEYRKCRVYLEVCEKCREDCPAKEEP